VLFIDTSHRSFMNSDATTEFLWAHRRLDRTSSSASGMSAFRTTT
jgi:hypothetical protein